MSSQERQQLKALFVATAAYFGQDLADAAIALYVEDLVDLPFADVVGALRDVRRDPKTVRCPLPSGIRARLNPESDPESEAVMIVGRILDAIARIGPYRYAEAKNAIGMVGWRLVQMEGGWEQVCSLESDDLPTLKAQWRNLAKALIQRGTGKCSELPQLPSPPSAPGPARLDFGSMFKSISGGKS